MQLAWRLQLTLVGIFSNRRLRILQEPLTTPIPSDPAHFWQCCYGAHPRCLVLAEQSGVSLGDFRVSCAASCHLGYVSVCMVFVLGHCLSCGNYFAPQINLNPKTEW